MCLCLMLSIMKHQKFILKGRFKHPGFCISVLLSRIQNQAVPGSEQLFTVALKDKIMMFQHKSISWNVFEGYKVINNNHHAQVQQFIVYEVAHSHVLYPVHRSCARVRTGVIIPTLQIMIWQTIACGLNLVSHLFV